MGLTLRDRIEAAIAHVPDFPTEGFPFRDVTPLLERDPTLFREIVNAMADEFRGAVDCVVCIESFGYAFGAPVAFVLGARVVLARRAGKLPRPTHRESYDMIYDQGRALEMHQDAFPSSSRVLIVDDVLASGGSALATMRLVERSGGFCVGVACVADVPLLADMPARREVTERAPRVVALASL